MRIRVKKNVGDNINRIDSTSKIDDIVVKEDLLNPQSEQINIFFRGADSSGILNLNKLEAQKLVDSFGSIFKLVKNSKTIK
ncbi:MAG: hypothetical protein WCX73_02035 [Candidatus Pacearchaeota archaeon]|jgi:hypothetical protein